MTSLAPSTNIPAPMTASPAPGDDRHSQRTTTGTRSRPAGVLPAAVATAGRLPNATSEQWLHVTSRPNHGLPCGSVPQNFRVHHVPITSIDESPSACSDLQVFRSRPAESAICASVNRAIPAFRMPYSQTLIAKFHSFGLQAVGATVNIRRESDVIPRLTPRDQHEARSLGRDAGARGEELTWSTCLPRGITKVIHDRLVANGPASASGGRRSC